MALVGKHGHPDWFVRGDDLPAIYQVDVIERPEDCSDENCWRHGGKGSCRCDDETEGGTWQPGC